MASDKKGQENPLERQLPHNSEVERATVGSIMLDNDLVFEAITSLGVDHFYHAPLRYVFDCIVTLFHQSKEINPVTLSHELQKRGQLEQVGGYPFLASLTLDIPRQDSLSTFIEILEGKRILRQAIKEDALNTSEALEGADEPDALISRRLQRAIDMSRGQQGEGLTSLHSIGAQVIERSKELVSGQREISGLRTGFPDVDQMIGGMERGNLVYVAARPSMGKTSYLLNCIDNITDMDPQAVIAVFSYETTKQALLLRMICSRARVNLQRYKSNFMSEADWKRFDQAMFELRQKNIFFDDSYSTNTSTMLAKCLQLKAIKGRLDFVAADYLQLMPPPPVKLRYENRQQEVSTQSRELKGTAKILDCPLMALSQLSRAPESRADHRPQLADLRESGSLEQDADIVKFIFRKPWYLKQAGQPVEDPTESEVIVAKNRDGETGTIPLRFDEVHTRFDSRADF